ncbi:MAG TPA: hypothetical protein VK181_01595, partial [Rhizobium sp.]|nr:hypothetical protein [Rhizobium sp.]
SGCIILPPQSSQHTTTDFFKEISNYLKNNTIFHFPNTTPQKTNPTPNPDTTHIITISTHTPLSHPRPH